MSNSYPFYRSPTSGYLDYPDSTHVGTLDYLSWNPGTIAPSGLYHPIHLHHIRDSFKINKQRASAASIELGVGRHIAEVARYANRHNLGTPQARVGTAYFYTIGSILDPAYAGNWWDLTSGIPTALTVNDTLAATTIQTNNIIFTSGYYSGEFVSLFLNNSAGDTDAYFGGFSYLDTISDRNNLWKFEYGNVATTRDLSMFSGALTIDRNGIAAYSGDMRSMYLVNPSYLTGIKMVSSTISGVFDTFLSESLSENGKVTHNISTGHYHEAGVWSTETNINHDIETTMVVDGSYIYGATKAAIVRFDTTSSSTAGVGLETFKNGLTPYNSNHRVDVNGTNYGVFGRVFGFRSFVVLNNKSVDIKSSAMVRGSILNNNIAVYYESNSKSIKTIDEDGLIKEYPIDISGNDKTEAYRIGNTVYFVMGGAEGNVIYSFDGTKAGLVFYQNLYSIVASCLWKNQIVYIARLPNDTYSVLRFNGRNHKPMAIFLKDDGEIDRIFGIDGTLFVSYLGNKTKKVHAYSYMEKFEKISSSPIIEYLEADYNELLSSPEVARSLLFGSGDVLATEVNMAVYYNEVRIYLQLGNKVRHIDRNLSCALSFDAVGPELVLPSGSMLCQQNAMLGNVTVTGFTTRHFDESNIKPDLSDQDYVLEPGREINQSEYTFDGDFSKSYIDRYLYNADHSETYTDITCSIVYNNKFYFGHRGDISVFVKDKGGMFSQVPTPTNDMSTKSVVKFLPVQKKLYALVQDFSECIAQYVLDTPDTPVSHTTIPYLPFKWGAPTTRIMAKDNINDTWTTVKLFDDKYGRNLIDCVAHDNSIYTISHQCKLSTPGTGLLSSQAWWIVSSKHTEKEFDGIDISYSGALESKEGFLLSSQRDTPMYDFVTTAGGDFITDNDNNYIITPVSGKPNGHHEFYMYNHSYGPYVVHDQVEPLYESAPESGIYSYRGATSNPSQIDVVRSEGIPRYNYRTISLNFLDKTLNTRKERTTINYNMGGGVVGFQLDSPHLRPFRNVNTPFVKIIVDKDNQKEIGDIEIDKVAMTDIVEDSNRNNIRYITSVTHNNSIYLLVQVYNKLHVYKISDFSEYYTITSELADANPYTTTVSQKVTFGNLSRVGIPVNADMGIPSYNSTNSAFYIDYSVDADYKNLLFTKINIAQAVGLGDEAIRILGDGDDLFVQKHDVVDYRSNKRYSTSSSISVNGTTYIPILCRRNNPTGDMFTVALEIDGTGSIRLLGKTNPTQIAYRPVGRTHILQKDGRIILSSIKLDDSEKSTVSYEQIKANPFADVVFGGVQADKTIAEQLSNVYNTFGKKKWIIGEYDIRIKDVLNIKETL